LELRRSTRRPHHRLPPVTGIATVEQRTSAYNASRSRCCHRGNSPPAFVSRALTKKHVELTLCFADGRQGSSSLVPVKIRRGLESLAGQLLAQVEPHAVPMCCGSHSLLAGGSGAQYHDLPPDSSSTARSCPPQTWQRPSHHPSIIPSISCLAAISHHLSHPTTSAQAAWSKTGI
jgi:hypothetical protein